MAQTSPPEPIAAGHWWLACGVVSCALGVLLGAACLVIVPSAPGRTVGLDVAVGRAGILAVSGVATFAWGTTLGLLSVPFRLQRRAAVTFLAVLLWPWLVLFVADIGYRRVLGIRPTASALAPVLASPGKYASSLSFGALLALAVALSALGAVSYWIASWVPRVALSARSVRPLLAFGLVLSVELALAFAPVPQGDRSAWIQRGVPIVGFVSGVKVPALSDTGTEAIAPGPLLTTAEPSPAPSPTPRPNVLLIVLESVSASYLGYGGATRPVSPNIDRLATTSRRFRHAWTVAPVTSPAVGGLLTSTLPRRSWTFDVYDHTDYPRDSLFSVMRGAGSDTALLTSDDQGSWGLRAFLAPVTATLAREAADFPGEHFAYGDDRSADDREVVNAAIDWMASRKAPWTLYVNFHRTHFPYWLPKGYSYPYPPTNVAPSSFNLFNYPEEDRVKARNLFDATLQFVDGEVGRLLEGLEAKGGGLDNTIVVLTADHGEAFGEHGLVAHAKSIYEPEMRVPLLLRWPGHVTPAEDETPVSLIDVVPTLLSLSGVPQPVTMQGHDLLDAASSNRPVILEVQVLGMQDGLVCWPWKLVIDRPTDTTMLFDLADDPQELENVAVSRPKVTASLRRLVEEMATAQVSYYESEERHRRAAPRIPRCPVFQGL